MQSVEFQLQGTYYQFAEADQSNCDVGLFDPARHRANPASSVLNSHGRGSVWLFSYEGIDYVLRHYHRGGLMRHLSQDQYLWSGLQQSRPWREFSLLLLMQELQLPCPKPYACCVHKRGLRSSGSLITEMIPDTKSLAETLHQRELDAQQWHAIGRTLRRFHDANIYHADLNAHNILLGPDAQVYVLDFDKGMQKKHARGWKFANLKRLQRSIMKCWMDAEVFFFSPASWDDFRDGYTAEPELESSSGASAAK